MKNDTHNSDLLTKGRRNLRIKVRVDSKKKFADNVAYTAERD